MKICRKCDNSYIVDVGVARKKCTKDTVPEVYLRCHKLGNKTCSYIKKSCDLHEQVKNNNNNNASK